MNTATHHEKGLAGEATATELIEQSGGDIIGSRVRNGMGEIDIIYTADGVISFTEVKKRKTLEDAMFAVSGKAWNRIASTAEVFMASRPDLGGLDWRYDLIVVDEVGDAKQICDAWRPWD